MNAIEAMVKVFDRPRELRIRSDKAGRDKLIVAVQDVGTGINDADTSELFKAFYTTKSEGLGWGPSDLSFNRGGSRRDARCLLQPRPWRDISVHPASTENLTAAAVAPRQTIPEPSLTGD